MNLHVLGSNSLGNCYILESGADALIIEAGVRMANIRKALDYSMRNVVGAVISHEHKDHAGYVKELIRAGVRVHAPIEVFRAYGLEGRPFTKNVLPGQWYKAGWFSIMPIEVVHDVTCMGYIIKHPEMGNMLFITDTITLNVLVPGMNHILIEANYADDIVDANIASGAMPEAMRPRLLNSHMELEQTKAILSENDLSQTDNIVLIHLSDGNADEERFVREVRELTGKMVYAANAGMTIDISKQPY